MSIEHVPSPLAGRRSPNLAGAIYGTIVATAVVAGLDKSDVPSLRAFCVLLATGLFFWGAHVYSFLLADRIQGHHRMRRDDVSRVISREWPLFQSSFPLAVPLAAGWLGIVGADVALTLALLVGVATLVGWGIAFSRGEGSGPAGILAAATVNAAVGLLIVGLKVALP